MHLHIQQLSSQELPALKTPGFEGESLSKKVLEMDNEQIAFTSLVTAIIANFRALQKKYTQNGFKVISIVSMLIYNTMLGLLQILSPLEQTLFYLYLKVIDDYLYKPLQLAC